MDKSAIKAYAVEARRKLIEAVRQKAFHIYITEDGALSADEANRQLADDGIFLTAEQSSARRRLCDELAALSRSLDKKAAFQHIVENAACTWFNRLIALRIMEVNDWLPSNIRILSGQEQGRIEPDAIRDVDRLDYVDPTKVAVFMKDESLNAVEKLYRYILTRQCNALSEILPGMFQRENDYTELLLPDALLGKDGIVTDLVTKIDEKNFRISTPTNLDEDANGQIEIIGWMYQFYISGKKDEVFAGLKKNIKINRETIPAATQLFTPEWIVKYMVENSLGRLWLDNHENAELRAKWRYYVDEAEQEPEVTERLRVLRSESPIKRPEDIKLIDPCMGSGHILVYAFDVLFQIYRSEGYSERDIPNLILQNNLFGLDIDERAGQLAYFALMIKARSYNRRFFRQENVPQPQVYATKDSEVTYGSYKHYMGNFFRSKEHQETLNYILDVFRDTKEYGSLIKLEERDYNGLLQAYETMEKPIARPMAPFNFMAFNIVVDEEIPPLISQAVLPLIEQAILLSNKYDVVVTNPPYMAPSPSQANWVKKNYPDSKSDLCVVFMERNFKFLKRHWYLSMITMHSWMFLSSYEKFREKLISTKEIVNMAHLGARAFEEIGGEVVQTTAFVMSPTNISDYAGIYVRLVDYVGQQVKKDAFVYRKERYIAKIENFDKIPGKSIAYWVSHNLLKAFTNKQLYSYTLSDGQNKTGDNARFVRYFWEVQCLNVGIGCKWLFYAKGGGYRKWYGNLLNVVDWSDAARSFYKKDLICRIIPEYLWYKKGITWCLVTNEPSFRVLPEAATFDVGGSSVFFNDYTFYDFFLGLLNSKVFYEIVHVFNPTINFQVKDIRSMPVIIQNVDIVESKVESNIKLSRTDWDSFETSWDFKRHPLVRGVYKSINPFERNILIHEMLEGSFQTWERECDERFNTLKTNEEELNRIFISIYGLQDELTPGVEDKDVTVRKADLSRDIRSFISYAVGCMFGRYSLDEPGLVFAGGKFDMTRYKTFMPEDDNILPINSVDYFDDDIVMRFVEFVRVVYGEDTLNVNLDFIAGVIYPNASGSARDIIRRYFLNDFYKDHLKVYQKRPIYWLFDSGKKDGFKALFYLHRYDRFTVMRARTDYLHPLQRKYNEEVKRLETLIGLKKSDSAADARDKANFRKEIDALQSKMAECRLYEQVVAHIAHQQIELDLDDGVKVNYAKFQGLEVPMDNGTIEVMDLLGRV